MSAVQGRLKARIRRAMGRARKPRPAILMYHRIGVDSFDPWGLVVERERFAGQMQWLAENRTVLPLTEFARLHKESSLPHKAVSLTFDDGYASVLDAVPLLERHRLQATVFLPTQMIERGEEFWWDELARLVLAWPEDKLQLAGMRLAVPAAHDADRSWPADARPRTPRQRLFRSLWSKLHAMPPAALDSAMAELRAQSSPSGRGTTDRPLTPQQARSVSPATLAFGSHGLTHASLPTLSDEQKAREIAGSIARCEAIAGARPASFAYPFGELDEASVSLAAQAGYACACATGDTFVSRRSDVFALPRLRVGNWEAADLRDMLGG